MECHSTTIVRFCVQVARIQVLRVASHDTTHLCHKWSVPIGFVQPSISASQPCLADNLRVCTILRSAIRQVARQILHHTINHRFCAPSIHVSMLCVSGRKDAHIRELNRTFQSSNAWTTQFCVIRATVDALAFNNSFECCTIENAAKNVCCDQPNCSEFWHLRAQRVCEMELRESV